MTSWNLEKCDWICHNCFVGSVCHCEWIWEVDVPHSPNLCPIHSWVSGQQARRMIWDQNFLSVFFSSFVYILPKLLCVCVHMHAYVPLGAYQWVDTCPCQQLSGGWWHDQSTHSGKKTLANLLFYEETRRDFLQIPLCGLVSAALSQQHSLCLAHLTHSVCNQYGIFLTHCLFHFLTRLKLILPFCKSCFTHRLHLTLCPCVNLQLPHPTITGTCCGLSTPCEMQV